MHAAGRQGSKNMFSWSPPAKTKPFKLPVIFPLIRGKFKLNPFFPSIFGVTARPDT